MKPIFTDYGKHLMGAIVFSMAFIAYMALGIAIFCNGEKHHLGIGYAVSDVFLAALFLAGAIAEIRAVAKS